MSGGGQFKLCGLCSQLVEESAPLDASYIDFFAAFLQLEAHEVPSKACTDCIKSGAEAKAFRDRCARAVTKLKNSNLDSSIILGRSPSSSPVKAPAAGKNAKNVKKEAPAAPGPSPARRKSAGLPEHLKLGDILETGSRRSRRSDPVLTEAMFESSLALTPTSGRSVRPSRSSTVKPDPDPAPVTPSRSTRTGGSGRRGSALYQDERAKCKKCTVDVPRVETSLANEAALNGGTLSYGRGLAKSRGASAANRQKALITPKRKRRRSSDDDDDNDDEDPLALSPRTNGVSNNKRPRRSTSSRRSALIDDDGVDPLAGTDEVDPLALDGMIEKKPTPKASSGKKKGKGGKGRPGPKSRSEPSKKAFYYVNNDGAEIDHDPAKENNGTGGAANDAPDDPDDDLAAGLEDEDEIFPTIGPYQCEICQDITDTKEEFVNHIKRLHRQVVDEGVLLSLEEDLRKSRAKAKRAINNSNSGSKNVLRRQRASSNSQSSKVEKRTAAARKASDKDDHIPTSEKKQALPTNPSPNKSTNKAPPVREEPSSQKHWKKEAVAEAVSEGLGFVTEANSSSVPAPVPHTESPSPLKLPPSDNVHDEDDQDPLAGVEVQQSPAGCPPEEEFSSAIPFEENSAANAVDPATTPEDSHQEAEYEPATAAQVTTTHVETIVDTITTTSVQYLDAGPQYHHFFESNPQVQPDPEHVHSLQPTEVSAWPGDGAGSSHFPEGGSSLVDLDAMTAAVSETHLQARLEEPAVSLGEQNAELPIFFP